MQFSPAIDCMSGERDLRERVDVLRVPLVLFSAGGSRVERRKRRRLPNESVCVAGGCRSGRSFRIRRFLPPGNEPGLHGGDPAQSPRSMARQAAGTDTASLAQIVHGTLT